MNVRLNNKNNNMLEKIQNMQSQMENASKELDDKVYSFEVGGGAVKAEIKGSMELTGLYINQETINEGDGEMLSDLIIAAVNGALNTAKKDKNDTIENISAGISLPNIPGLF